MHIADRDKKMTTKITEEPSEMPSVESEGLSADSEARVFSGDSLTQAKKEIFLDTFRERGTILHSYKAADVSRKTIYRWLADDEVFKDGLVDAKEDFADLIEEQLYKRLESAGQNRTNIELLAALKAVRREKWGDNITVTPSESLITFKVLRVEVVDYVKPELPFPPKQLQEPAIDITSDLDNP